MSTSEPPCVVHRSHAPRPLRTVRHHIQPLGMGGPDVPANWVQTCDTGHFNMHRLMGYLLRGEPLPRQGSALERQLAQQGFDAWVAAGKPGHPVFEVDWNGHPIGSAWSLIPPAPGANV